MQTRILSRMVFAILIVGGGPGAWAQGAAPQTSSQPPQTQTPPASRGAGRRDPFRAIVVKKATEETPVCTSPGIRGLLIGQLQVQGVVRGINNEWIAMVDNNTNRAYFLRAKDEVCNGVVTRITEDSVVFEERVTITSGRTQTREVIKRLEERAGRKPTPRR
ncbi:MAG: hypothetical protein HYS38_04315 [Acidobacteria bacterium]|nr:hypothetical protein [Acidobacteriota bacterium]